MYQHFVQNLTHLCAVELLMKDHLDERPPSFKTALLKAFPSYFLVNKPLTRDPLPLN